MHRSGTSMIAQLLNLCGLDLGPSERFLPANEFNPSGYFENEGFVNIDEALLTHLEGSWDNPPIFKEGWEYDTSLEQIVHEAGLLLEIFSKSVLWGWKDPRTTVLLPFWKSLIPDLRFVICIRSPLEVAKSLARRDRMPFQKGVYLWNQYMRAAIRDTEGCSRIFTFYEDFFNDATTEIDRLIEFCGLQKPDDLSSLHGVISHELKHHTSETSELLNEDKVITEYKLFYIGLRALTTQGFVQPNSDHTREEFISENISKFFKLLEQFHDEQEMAHLQSELADREQQITDLLNERQERICRLEENIKDLEIDRDIWRANIKSLEKDRDNWRSHAENLEGIIADREGRINNLAEHAGNLERTIADREAQINNLIGQLNDLEHSGREKDIQISGLKDFEGKAKSTLLYKMYRFLRLHKIYKMDRLLPVGTRRKKISRLIHLLSALLTRRNLGRIMKYLRLYGLTATYKKVKSNLWSDSAYVFLNDGAVKASPAINIEILREEEIPNEDVTISVVIPVKNGGEDFRCLLSMIKNQKGFKDVEIIVVDSGSTDRSLEISEEFGAKIIQILPEEFSHSYARNLGAECASGDYLLFTVQDALLPSDLWLHELFSVIKGNDVVAVSCAEYPREDADLFYRVLSWNHYKFLEVDKQDRIMCKPNDENYLTIRKNGQLSDIACLIYKGVFMKYRFRSDYAEDLDLGIRLIRDGYKLAFISSTRIIHSHNRPAYYHLKRGYVDNLILPQILPGHPVLTIEAERLFRDIIFTYEVVNTIVHEELQKVAVPCRIGKLSSIVTEKFRTAVKDSYPSYIKVINNGFVDSNFTSFLQDMSKQHYPNGNGNSRYDGILVDAMLSFTMMIFGYMEDTYELIDDTVLEEFKASLYKAYPFLCGVHLAYCFFRGSESTKEKLKEINNELTKEV